MRADAKRFVRYDTRGTISCGVPESFGVAPIRGGLFDGGGPTGERLGMDVGIDGIGILKNAVTAWSTAATALKPADRVSV